MPRPAERLLKVLQNELNEYRTILDLTVRERAYIIKNEIDALEDSTLEKEKCIRKSLAHEGERKLAVEELKRLLRIKGEEPTLSVIGDHLGSEDASSLEAMQKSLRMTVESLDRVNRENARLLVRSINFVDENIRFIAQSGAANPTYQDGGTVEENKEHMTLLDRKG